uniref:(northern house mosquito) hypothetical protein n=1 Tax=Culex pipiens TaxID=7175 RepID=A0A8D8DXU0_CULPI
MGHLRRSRQGPAVRVRKIRRGAAVLLDRQPGLAAQLPRHVVPGDPQVLPGHARNSGRLQERPAVHVPGRDVPLLLWRPQPVRAGGPQKRPGHAGRGAGRGQGARRGVLRDERLHVLWRERGV